jgi:hypothetical protein
MTRLFVMLFLMGVTAFGHARIDESEQPASRFMPVDVMIDSDTDLGAWQVRVETLGQNATLVGVEGGDGVWSNPPMYDPAALAQGQILLAAYDTTNTSPSGNTRVARLHLMVVGEPQLEIELIAAGDTDGHRLDATASVVKGHVQ